MDEKIGVTYFNMIKTQSDECSESHPTSSDYRNEFSAGDKLISKHSLSESSCDADTITLSGFGRDSFSTPDGSPDEAMQRLVAAEIAKYKSLMSEAE